MVDILIKNGTIIDGTGNPGFKGNIIVNGDRVRIFTGDSSPIEAAKIIDASGYIVAPGFIDPHTHSDLMALAEPRNEPKTRQGVCTEIIGLDGIGYAPLSKKNLKMMLLLFAGVNGYPELDYKWSSVAEYLEQFHHRTAGNIAYLIPNSCLRAETVGWEMRPANQNHIGQMQAMIRQGMAEGALGMSTGLGYPPSVYADTDELVELCRTVADCGGVYVTHVRYLLGDGIFDGFKEALTIGRLSGCPVHISHYFAGVPLRGQTARMLQFIDDARASGIDLTFDAYPYEAGSTSMTGLLPPWAHSGGPYALLERLYDRAERERMRRETAAHLGNLGELEGMIVSAVKSQRNKWYEGLSIARISGKLQKDPWDVVCDLMIEEKLQATFYTFSGDMRDVKVIMTHPAHMFASDGLRIGGMPNPRTYGTFARALGQMARDEKVIPLEQAIRKMTSFPAQRFGLRDRGLLWDGMKADIVVFNPATVNAQATFPEPKRFPVGIEYVLVNGQVVIDRGQHTGALPGEPVTMTGEVSG